MPNSLVTGGAGFIGSHVVDYLIALMGHHVVVLDDLSGGFLSNLPTGAQFVRGSVTDVDVVDRLFQEHRFDYVYHLAAYAAEGLSHYIKRFNYENNLLGSVNLINAAVNYGVRGFVFTSSMAVYGSGQVPFQEDMPPLPEDSYGIAKLAVERELAISHKMFGLDYVILRPHNVYGERQNIWDPYRNVVGIFMRQLLLGKPMTVFGDGSQQRAFTYIGDIVEIVANCIHVPAARNEVINLGSDEVCTISGLAEQVALVMGQIGKTQTVGLREEVHTAYADHANAKRIFGDIVQTPLHEGLQRMSFWVRKIGSPSEPYGNTVTPDLEIHKNLPVAWEVHS